MSRVSGLLIGDTGAVTSGTHAHARTHAHKHMHAHTHTHTHTHTIIKEQQDLTEGAQRQQKS